MARRSVASARRTQLVSTYGVGSLFPAMDESFMICGIDEWYESRATEIAEPRLALSLGVQTFRAPPIGSLKHQDVPVIRFPDVHYCPSCRRLGRLRDFCSWNEHQCSDCLRDLTPSRFVACCPRGHIEEFPYFRWVHSGQERQDADHRLTLRTRGRTSSLADIEIGCSCGVKPVSMAGSFNPGALKELTRCQGARPWLPDSEPETCSEVLRTLQRGSSNVWFPMVRSALSIPPWSEGVHRILDKNWGVFGVAPAETLAPVIAAMGLANEEISVQTLVDGILERRGEAGPGEPPTDNDLRREEYKALLKGQAEHSPGQQFVCTRVDVDVETRAHFEQVSEVSRLREVRALEGFTRVTPAMPGMDVNRKAALAAGPVRWLPAIEVLGEGIFVQVDESRLLSWEETEFAKQRAGVAQRAEEVRAERFGLTLVPDVAPRELLLHSFAHILLNELSLDAGYPAASLRERLYMGPGQSGILVYTASADSAGSLGGLAAQSSPERIAAVIRSAVLRASWCSADPVCIEATSTGKGALNLAACHACLLLPETSCERLNEYLDRGTIIGTPDWPSAGFFFDLLSNR